MFRRLLIATITLMALALVTSGLGAGTAVAQQNPDFYVVNSSGKQIDQIMVSSARETAWGPDQLGTNVLGSGQRFAIRPGRNTGCVFDIRVVFADGTHREQRQVNTCSINEVVFTAQGAVARGGDQQANPDFRLVNRSGRTINEVYVSSANDTGWGNDRLGQGTLNAGQAVTISLPRSGNCTYDIRVVYDNSTAAEKRRINTCTITEVAFP